MVIDFLKGVFDTLAEGGMSEEKFASKKAREAVKKAEKKTKSKFTEHLQGEEYTKIRQKLMEYEVEKNNARAVMESLIHYGVSDAENFEQLIMVNSLELNEKQQAFMREVDYLVNKNKGLLFDEENISAKGAFSKEDWDFIDSRIGSQEMAVPGLGNISFGNFYLLQHQANQNAHFINDTKFGFMPGGKNYGKFYDEELQDWFSFNDSPEKVTEMINEFRTTNPMMGFFNSTFVQGMDIMFDLAKEGNLSSKTLQLANAKSGLREFISNVENNAIQAGGRNIFASEGILEKTDETIKKMGGTEIESTIKNTYEYGENTVETIDPIYTAALLQELSKGDEALMRQYGLNSSQLKTLMKGEHFDIGGEAFGFETLGVDLGSSGVWGKDIKLWSDERIERDMKWLAGMDAFTQMYDNISEDTQSFQVPSGDGTAGSMSSMELSSTDGQAHSRFGLQLSNWLGKDGFYSDDNGVSIFNEQWRSVEGLEGSMPHWKNMNEERGAFTDAQLSSFYGTMNKIYGGSQDSIKSNINSYGVYAGKPESSIMFDNEDPMAGLSFNSILEGADSWY
tara:strand:- start:6932 stop:8626 length:1695 start_codon:yes stop_codon:yes gene_type:complete